jgi:hypothetical protein
MSAYKKGISDEEKKQIEPLFSQPVSTDVNIGYAIRLPVRIRYLTYPRRLTHFQTRPISISNAQDGMG